MFTNTDFGGFYCIVFTVVLAGVIFFVIRSLNTGNNATKSKLNSKLQELQPIDTVTLSKPVTGLRSINPSYIVTCAILENDLVFISQNGEDLGRIPRDAINQIVINDRSQITQSVTVGRVLALGIFALAAPKTKKLLDYYLLLDWENQSGERENTIFEFDMPSANILANQAAASLKKYIKPKIERLKTVEKKCPYCAEIIKKEAIVCRFCGRDLTVTT